MAIVALDLGKKHTGICLYLEGICIPKLTVDTDNINVELEHIAKEYGIEIVVIGMPYSLDGRETDMCNWIRDYVNRDSLLSSMHIEYISEALTSTEAENIMREHYSVDLRKHEKDAVAACLILENYINGKKEQK